MLIDFICTECKIRQKVEEGNDPDLLWCSITANHEHHWIEDNRKKNKYNFISSVHQVFEDGLNIIKKKNVDYATQDDPFKNFRSAEILNVSVEQAILIRTLDKMSRIGNVLKNGSTHVIEETVEDTILDAVNYLAILLAYRRYMNDKK